MKPAYYNENDPKAAAWLRELIKNGHIAKGDVDERSIVDVQPDDLSSYGQCHFFAGIGGWSLALRMAGWPDDSDVWTGSCPCQPFSIAGKRKGTNDERHLWPEFSRLIKQRQPAICFGEQVASKAGRDWLVGVRTDLEALGYAVGAADLCAACAGETCEGRVRRGDSESWERTIVGAPHIRQRLFWVAYAEYRRSTIKEQKQEFGSVGGNGVGGLGKPQSNGRQQWRAESGRPISTAATSIVSGLANNTGPQGRGCAVVSECAEQLVVGSCGASDGLGISYGQRPQQRQFATEGSRQRNSIKSTGSAAWSDFSIIPSIDGKARRAPSVESGVFPLAHGVPGRVGLLRGYGNAIVPQVAATFIQASVEALSQ